MDEKEEQQQNNKHVSRKPMAVIVLAVLLCAFCWYNVLADSRNEKQPSHPSALAGTAEIPRASSPDAYSPAASPSDSSSADIRPFVYSTNESGEWKQTDTGWFLVTASSDPVKDEWIRDNGKYYYVNSFGVMEYDEFRRIGDYWYHLGKDGALDTGRFSIDANEYYANEDGVLFMNTWVPLGPDWYYCTDMGLIMKNGMTADGYLVDADGRLIMQAGSNFEGFLYTNLGDHELYLNTGTADIIWKYLKEKDWTDTAIAGILGNFQQESGVSPTLEEAGSHIGYGLGQWSYERRTSLENYALTQKKNVGDIYTQLDYLCCESSEGDFVERYAKTNWESPAAAAIEWGKKWERYNMTKDYSMSGVRIPYAEAYFAHYVYGVKFLVSSTRYTEAEAQAASVSNAAAVDLTQTEQTETGTSSNAENQGNTGIMADGTFKVLRYCSKNGNMITKVIREEQGQNSTASDAVE